MGALGEPVLVPAQDKPVLELVPFHIALIQPRLASVLMGVLTEAAPLQEFRHIKRVRKVVEPGGPPKLEIILCSAQRMDPDTQIPDSDSPPAFPEEIAQLIETHSLTELKITQASKHPPATREQWAEWTKFWPLYWNAPSSKGTDAEVPLSSDEAAAARKWMHMALQEAESAHCSPGNAAVIIDPSTDAVVAVGRDSSAESPLGHAVMNAVAAAAAENLRIWPPGDAAVDTAGDQRGADKRQKQEGAGDVSQSAAPGRGPDPERQYLCTGYDCYVVREPCAMCAMALVHSRLRRVVFCKPDPDFGALGGSFKLHAEKSLNHHYTVFHLPLL